MAATVLFFKENQQKLEISKNPMSASGDVTKITVNMDKNVKELLLKFREVYNIEDVADRHICLTILLYTFQRLQNNDDLVEYFISIWIRSFKTLYLCLFPPVQRYEFLITRKEEKPKSLFNQNRNRKMRNEFNKRINKK